MKLPLIIVLLFFSYAYCSDVLEFTDDTFESSVPKFPFLLVEFFAPWCGHCKALAPHYEEAATRLKEHDLSIAKVDCTANKKVCEKYGVTGYPTLKIFKNGAVANDYSGGRTADGIVSYMISKSGPSSRSIETTEQLEKFLASQSVVIVGYFKKEGSELHKTFQAAADKLNEDFRFAHTTNKALFPDDSGDSVYLHRPKAMANKFEESFLKYSNDASSQVALKSWIENNSNGLCGLRTSSNAKFFSQRPLIVVFYAVDYEKNAKGSNYWRNRIMKVAKNFEGKFYFAISNAKDFSPELSKDFGIEQISDSSLYVTARDSKGRKFKMNADFSMDTFEAFLNELQAGTLVAYLKSEVAPSADEQAKNDVKIATASNFEELVNDPSKDVLIEFYAPWCGHCKSLAPKFEELAKKLKDEPELVIAKMDATANDVPGPYEVRGFPTIYFAGKNNKSNPKTYSSGREVDDFVKWLAKESTNTLKGYNRDGSPLGFKSKTEL